MSKKPPVKSAVFTITQDGKHFVCQCMTNDPDENKCCGVKISAYAGKDKNAPRRGSNLKRHLQCFHSELFKVVKDKYCIQSNEQVTSNPAKQGSREPRRYQLQDILLVTKLL